MLRWGYVGLLEQYSPIKDEDGNITEYYRFFGDMSIFDQDEDIYLEFITSEEYNYIKEHSHE